MKRIGILGGTFNPIHIGHLMIAQAVLEKFNLDKVVFVPACLPPHKSGRGLIAAEHRLRMVRLAVRGNRHLEVSSFEIAKGGKSYSVDTVRYFRRRYPGTKLFFIIGSDHIVKLHTWRDIREVVKMASFVAVYRPGFKTIRSKIRVKSMIIPGVHTSSSDIRRRLVAGKTVKHLIPENVLRYIRKHKLYRLNKT
ncbi:MAG TPA: nicotinic acid mononucleotide adenylyltransferase [Candidatus Omnitrophica bacterium]|nr:MAG: nicotinate (nicotinamide) nucleotide adenylyltransferase [Omnitrophica WOR_2 bacterium GWA2_53_43]HBO97308.1 nicotinic acid mononucleotide adenylyltransferase [Candidatus Omnitrophota bacterium]HCI44866.1 nicotinic acid mononucleotide adenylyltransferase [Candidatus Omnitrophota bacterium]